MNITRFRHTGVKPDGTFEQGLGAVKTKGSISRSHERGGCGMRGCKCSPGHWIAVALPRTDEGVVEGFTIRFKNKQEFNRFLTQGNLEMV